MSSVISHRARQAHLYPKSLETRVGGKRENPLSLEILSDWGERVQPYILKNLLKPLVFSMITGIYGWEHQVDGAGYYLIRCGFSICLERGCRAGLGAAGLGRGRAELLLALLFRPLE